jgi:methionyl-tRNA formyltransferase
MTQKLKVAFCGTPDFSLPTLEALFRHPSIDLQAVITMPDRPAGRGQELKSPPVAEFAKTHNLKLFQVENINREAAVLDELEKMNLDFILVLAFAQFLGSRVLNMPKLGCFNIHTSILPKYRGAAPIQYALLNGDQETGVSIQRMVKEMDAGDLVHFDRVVIDDQDRLDSLSQKLKMAAGVSTNALIEKILNQKIEYTPQDKNGISFAPTINKEDGFLDFKKTASKTLKNKMRAFDPWPGTYCFMNSLRMKVFEMEAANKKLSPGETSVDMGMLLVGTLDGAFRLKTVQLEGKKQCSDTELLNGLKNKGGPIIINP